MDKGLVGAINNSTKGRGDDSLREDLNRLQSSFVSARVLDIIYDENSDDWDQEGEWNGIGTIKFEMVNFQTTKDKTRGTAKPFNPNFKTYPLKNEIVYLFRLPSSDMNDNSDAESYYYLPPVPIWNHPHHNAMPNPIQGQPTSDAQSSDYDSIEGGSVRRVEDGSTEIELNKGSNGTFTEKSNIHPLLPFAGDVILEGRFGNSIRLGNTAKTDSEYANSWSSAGDNGNPITIIRNGQPEDSSEEGWLPITEDVNNDISSITLTSNQKLPLELSNEDYSAFNSAPESSYEYTGNQVVLNSGRLIFNSKNSDIILSSAGNVAVNAIKTLGLSGDKSVVINSSNISIGNKDADQRLVRGDDFMIQFQSLVQGVKNLCEQLKTAQNWPGGAPVPNVPVITVAINTAITAQKILDNMKGDNKLLSKVAKTE